MNSQNPTLEEITTQIIACRQCPRLVAWREEVALKKRRAFRDWEYWGKPVPGFGDTQARLLVIGLAPGAHGSNRTGRVFTGDDSGVFLYRALYKAGFANQPTGFHPDDGLRLNDVYVSAVCRCVPPDNKPSSEEIGNCLPYLAAEMAALNRVEGIVLLGRIAMDGLIDLYRKQGIRLPKVDFAHAKLHRFDGGLPWWITSYHPSRQNTQTGRLTEAMFDEVWALAKALLTDKTD